MKAQTSVVIQFRKMQPTLLEVWSIEEQAHKYSTESTGNGDSGNPRKDKEANSLEINGFNGAIAETDADGGASNAHGSGDGEGILREEKDCDGGTHFHG
jgi:hypothetical protein